MLEQIATPFNINRHELFISASIGIVFAPENGEETLTLLKKADKAMYLAKESGKNRFQFYTSNDQKKAIKRLMLETALRRALQKQEFILQYQPQVDVKTGNICGVEALLRWQQNIFDNISPKHFIPLLEETGMIVDVGEWYYARLAYKPLNGKSKEITYVLPLICPHVNFNKRNSSKQ